MRVSLMPGERVNSVEKLLKMLDSDDEGERMQAAWALGNHDDVAITRRLAKKLQEEDVPTVREVVVLSLMRHRRPESVEVIAELLRSDNAYARNAAIEILRNSGATVVFPVVKQLLEDPDPDVRLFGVNVLGEVRTGEAADMLCRVLEKEKNINVVAAAIEHLGEIGFRQQDREAVKSVARRFPDPFISFAVDLALRKMGAGDRKGRGDK